MIFVELLNILRISDISEDNESWLRPYYDHFKYE